MVGRVFVGINRLTKVGRVCSAGLSQRFAQRHRVLNGGEWSGRFRRSRHYWLTLMLPAPRRIWSSTCHGDLTRYFAPPSKFTPGCEFCAKTRRRRSWGFCAVPINAFYRFAQWSRPWRINWVSRWVAAFVRCPIGERWLRRMIPFFARAPWVTGRLTCAARRSDYRTVRIGQKNSKPCRHQH